MNKKIETEVVHAGEREFQVLGAVNLPIFQTSMFECHGDKEYRDIQYIRLNNLPNHAALHKKLSVLEKGEDALVAASGMATITSAIFSFVHQNDHIMAQNTLYGGTHSFLIHDAPNFNIHTSFFNIHSPQTWEQHLTDKTKLIYVESITNPLLRVGYLKEVAKFAKSHDLISVIDNTFASPINFNPIDIGFDLVVHSCTKYLNGHSDIVAGCIIGKSTHIQKIKDTLNHLGGSLDPHACFLLNRGIKTLALRVRQQNQSALEIAKFLENHTAIKTVNYPGLPKFSDHEQAKSLFHEGYGGMLSFEVKGDVQKADRFLQALSLPFIAPSLGGVESLITRPATTSHRGLSKTEREQSGISDQLIRMSVGIEATQDLIEDIDQALRKL